MVCVYLVTSLSLSAYQSQSFQLQLLHQPIFSSAYVHINPLRAYGIHNHYYMAATESSPYCFACLILSAVDVCCALVLLLLI
jgi:hypothetical protein